MDDVILQDGTSYVKLQHFSSRSFAVYSFSIIEFTLFCHYYLGMVHFLNSLLGGLDDSHILAGDTSMMSQLNSWLLPRLQSSDKSYWVLCWRASRDGWAGSTFHSLCDNKGPTVTIIHVSSYYILGGYTDQSWICM